MINSYLFVLSFSLAASLSASEPDASLCGTAEQEVASVIQPTPSYPQHASLLCVEGWVQAEFTVGIYGEPLNIKVVDSNPSGVFDTAVEQIKRWRFRPACKQGVPVERRVSQQLDFILSPEMRSICPAEINDQTLELLIELAAFYGNIAEQLEFLSPNAVVIPAYEDQALDDYGLISQFHYQTMENILEVYSDGGDQRFQADFLTLFNAQRIANDVDFEETELLFKQFREQARANRLRTVELFDQIRGDVEALRNATDLSQEDFLFLVERFHGGFSGPEAEAFLAEQRQIELLEDQAMSDLENALGFLHDNRRYWQPASGSPYHPEFVDELMQLDYMDFFNSSQSLALIESESRAALIEFWAAEP